MENKKKSLHTSGFAITSLVLGIVSFIPWMGLILGILALIFGFIGLSQIRKGEAQGKGLAVAGIILGILGILFTILLFAFIMYVLVYYGSSVEGGDSFDDVDDSVAYTRESLQINQGLLELYKNEHGRYPSTLYALDLEEYPYEQYDDYFNDFSYDVSADGQSYAMKSAGPDGEFDTSDDIY